MIDIQQIFQYVRDAGVTGLLVAAVIGVFRKWWVPGWQYTEKVDECDEWKRLALGGTHLAERSVSIAKEAVEVSTSDKVI